MRKYFCSEKEIIITYNNKMAIRERLGKHEYKLSLFQLDYQKERYQIDTYCTHSRRIRPCNPVYRCRRAPCRRTRRYHTIICPLGRLVRRSSGWAAPYAALQIVILVNRPISSPGR